MTKKLAVLSARLEPNYIEALGKVAKAQGITKSNLLRMFAANAESLYSLLERKQREQTKLNGDLSKWILDHRPPGATLEALKLVAAAMNHAIEITEEGLKADKAKGGRD